ncbi:MAG: hypothetical protein ACRDHM_05080 [Actinomycetota bacterium]
MDDRLLSIYLNDHLAGATAGALISRRTAGSNRGTKLAKRLDSLATEIEQDRDTLLSVMQKVGATPNRAKTALVKLAERTGRVLKLNGRLVEYSPLSRVEELEILRLGVEGKLALWRTLEKTRGADPRLKALDFAALAERAERQRDELETMRLQAAEEAFGKAPARSR